MTDTLTRLAAALSDRYTIERELGEGGMATVFLAEDIKHHRKVAIKLLKPELAAVLGAERFVQEITTTAALQHPHILPLFDSGEAEGFLWYAMPFIDGETLRDKLNRETQFGIDDAIRITTEIADALDYAHRHGVIHRDIKPENILLHDGRPMVADFGIALAVSAAAGGRMTETGLSLGTPHYMSPEQATAEKEITARSDVYSLGSMLYEMLAGEPPHLGGSAQQIIMKIIAEDAQPLGSLRKSVPNNVTAAVAKSLEKLPADRFESAKAFSSALKDPSYTFSGLSGATPGAALSPANARRLPWALAIVAGLAVAAAVWGWSRTTSEGRAALAYQVHLTPSENDVGFVAMQVAIGPRAERLVYSDTVGGTRQLWLKERGSAAAQPIPGTIGGQAPFLSPDGNSVAYAVGTRLMRIPLAGGSASQISDSASVLTQVPGAWLDDGTIVFLGAAGDLVFSVDAEGGPTTRVFNSDDLQNSFPVDFSPIPGHRKFIVSGCDYLSCANPRVHMVDLETGLLERFLPGAVGAWALPVDRLLYLLSDGSAFVAPYRPNTNEVGVGVPVFNNVMIGALGPELAISADGEVLHAVGVGATPSNLAGFVSVDSLGTITLIDSLWTGDFLNNTTIELSPDGQTAVFSLLKESGTGGDIFLKPFPVGSPTRFSFDGELNARAVWNHDGSRIAWISDRDGAPAIWWQRADGSGVPEKLEVDERNVFEVNFTTDGEWMLYRTDDIAAGRGDIYAKRLNGDTATVSIAATEAEETSPTVSPDGQWIAFTVRIGALKEVIVRPFPNVEGGRTQVSVDGGAEPLWSADGSQLYYRQIDLGRILVADVATEGGFRVTGRRILSETTPGVLLDNDDSRQYTLMPDNKNLLMMRRNAVDVATPEPSPLILRERALVEVEGSP